MILMLWYINKVASERDDKNCSLKTKQIIRQQKMISVEIYTSQRFNFKS